MQLRAIEDLLPNLVRKECRVTALSNWALIYKSLAEQTLEPPSEESQRALVATILVETGSTFAPIKELGGEAYFRKNYWGNKAVREALGNITPTDAEDYCGRGFIQLTGRHNYEKCGGALNLPLLSQPQLLLEPEPSARACAWFGHAHGLIEICNSAKQYTDSAARERVWTRVRKVVNGGNNGLLVFLAHLQALGVK